jgi:glycolate dehydrogenase iron-sulfur subunit
LFRRMRSAMAGDFGQGWPKKAVYHFLSHEQQLRMAAKFAQLGQKVALDRLFEDFKLGNIPLKRMPRFNERPFRERFSEVNEPRGQVRGRVLYFTGCATNYVFDDIGRAVLKVLTRMGYRVEIPADQVCCGLPMALQGDPELARNNILRNLDLLDREDVDAVITDCATCGSALGSEYGPILEELDEDTARARGLAAKTKDISLFLWEHRTELALLLAREGEPRKVTYHAPCHLRNHQGVLGEVERLLSILPGVEYVRTPDFDMCCGGGGTFFYDHPEISRQMVDKKIVNARASGAVLWATGCPGCRINLAGNLSDDDRLEVVHPGQVVAAALGE